MVIADGEGVIDDVLLLMFVENHRTSAHCLCVGKVIAMRGQP